FRELALHLRRRAVARPARDGGAQCLDDRRMRVSQRERPPGEHVVNVAIAVHVPQIRALPPRDEARDAADGAKGAHGTIDAARDQFLRAREEPLRFTRLHAGLPCRASVTLLAGACPEDASSDRTCEAASCPCRTQ